MDVLQELDLLLECLTSVLGVDVSQRLIVEVLQHNTADIRTVMYTSTCISKQNIMHYTYTYYTYYIVGFSSKPMDTGHCVNASSACVTTYLSNSEIEPKFNALTK